MNFTFLKILVKKEFAQIAKDRSALVIAFLMPLILVVIYGYAMRMDIKPVKVGFVSDLGSKIERDLLGGFLGSKYLQTRVYTDLESARRDFRAHEIESILYFDPRFAAKFQNTLSGLGGTGGGINLNLSSDESSSKSGASDIRNTSGGVNASPFANGAHSEGGAANNGGGSNGAGGGASGADKDGAEIFLIQNATQSQLALLSYVYVAGVIEQVLAKDYGFLNANLNAAARPVSVNYRSWFNEANESTWYLVSAEYVGILGLICLFMVAVVISREWDRGTIASLYNSNASALEIVTAKVGAYYFLALLGGAMTLVYGQVLLGIPIRGSVAMLLATLCVFVLEMTCLGMLISAICKNQFLAQEYAIVIGYLPVTLLSGMIFDLRGLPAAVNFIGHLLPPTYAVESFRICFLSGGQSATLWVNLAIQALGAVLFFSLCVLSVKRGAR